MSNYVLDRLSEDDIAAVLLEAHRILEPRGLLCLASLSTGSGSLSRRVARVWTRSRLARLSRAGVRVAQRFSWHDSEARLIGMDDYPIARLVGAAKDNGNDMVHRGSLEARDAFSAKSATPAVSFPDETPLPLLPFRGMVVFPLTAAPLGVRGPRVPHRFRRASARCPARSPRPR